MHVCGGGVENGGREGPCLWGWEGRGTRRRRKLGSCRLIDVQGLSARGCHVSGPRPPCGLLPQLAIPRHAHKHAAARMGHTHRLRARCNAQQLGRALFGTAGILVHMQGNVWTWGLSYDGLVHMQGNVWTWGLNVCTCRAMCGRGVSAMTAPLGSQARGAAALRCACLACRQRMRPPAGSAPSSRCTDGCSILVHARRLARPLCMCVHVCVHVCICAHAHASRCAHERLAC